MPDAPASPTSDRARRTPSGLIATTNESRSVATTPTSADAKQTKLGGEPLGNPVLSDEELDRTVTVTGDRLLVVPPDGSERRSRGGILIPATAQSVERKGIWGSVRSVGPHVRHVDVGDEVLYLPDSAIEVEVKDDTYLIVRERDIHAIGAIDVDEPTGQYL